MTVSVQDTVFRYTANGVTTSFAYSCLVLAEADLVVTVDGVEVTTGFTISGIGSDTGGNVAFTTAPANLAAVIVRRLVALERTTDYQQHGDWLADVVNPDFDRLWMAEQQQAEQIDRSIKFPVADGALTTELPPAAQRASKVLGFDGNGAVATYSASSAVTDAGSVNYVPVSGPTAGISVTVQTWLDRLLTAGASLGAALVGFLQAGVGAILRTVQDKQRESFSVKDFGAVGDYATNDTAAIIAADAAAYAAGRVLYFPAGQYKITNGITKRAKWVGDGAPVLGTFPIEDDKRFLRPTYKTQMPGTTIFLSGTPTNTITTQRADQFASFTYGVRTTVGDPSSIEGIAIVQDMDVYDAGGSLTTWATDNRASGWDVGYCIEDSPGCYHRDLRVFGYFNVAGTAILSKETTGYEGDPDYNTFHGGGTAGDIGLALVGSQSNDGLDSGLSGTQGFGFNIFSKDHHSRDNTIDDWGTACLYIDGYTDAVNDDINGHYFHGGSIRSYCNNTVSLDHCSNLAFYGSVFETPKRGTANSSATQFLATANTSDVGFIHCRFSDGAGIYGASFSNIMGGKLYTLGGPQDEISICQGGHTVRLLTDGTEDPHIQLTTDPTSTSTGWSIRHDVSADNALDMRYDNVSRFGVDKDGGVTQLGGTFGGTKTIAAGVITIGTFSYYAVDTEAAAATDDLDTISGGVYDGQILILRAASSARDVVLKDATGNLRLSADFTLTNAQDRIMLQYDGAAWCELSRSDNTV